MSSRGLGGKFSYIADPVIPLLLNSYPNATVAYSLRKLRNAYAGPAIRVRRSSDNAETNIGFVDNVLDTATLLTFCGAGNGFVTTWYDQSGNSNHAIQATTGNQPIIVNSGTLITRNSKPYIQASSTQFFAFTTELSTPVSNSYSYWMPYEKDTTGNQAILLASGVEYHWLDYGTLQIISNGDSITISSSHAINTLYLINTITNFSIGAAMYRNGASIGTRGTLAGAATSRYLPSNAFRSAKITMSEFIFYPSNQDANKGGITSNINSYYTIY